VYLGEYFDLESAGSESFRKLNLPFRPAKSLKDLDERRLDWLRVMAHGGSAIAIPAAIQYCSKSNLTVPQWLVQAAAGQYPELLRTDVPKKRGRSVSLVDRYRQDMRDYARWDEVKTVRSKQSEIREEVDFLRANPKNASPSRLEDREKMLRWVGRSLKRAFECASMILAESSAFGGPDAIKSSYLKVEMVNRIQSQPLRYHILDADFLASIGIAPVNIRQVRVRKVVPLYDLTL
jgi:hypothetical protein